MAYTFQISFDGSDYSAVYPAPVTMKGGWVQDTFIWREKIDEFKVCKHDNSTIYDTLKAWFIDSTKFETKIWIKILKDGVQESLHWFGIKWGEIDFDLCTYTVEPLPYDLYSIYLEEFMDVNETVYGLDELRFNLFDWDTANDPWVYTCKYPAQRAVLLEDVIKETINDITSIGTANILSTLLWGDADESGTPATTSNGLLIDYVTSDYSVLRYACLICDYKSLKEIKISDIFEMLRVFQIYPFFDSNDKLRFEHISFFVDKFTDNAAAFTFNDYEQNYSYLLTEIPISEHLELIDGGEDYSTDVDWGELKIIYSSVSNRPDASEIKHSFTDYYTNLSYYYQNTGSFSSFKILGAGFANLVMDNWSNIDMTSFSAARHVLTLTMTAGQYCKSGTFHTTSLYLDCLLQADPGQVVTVGIYNGDTDVLISDTHQYTGNGSYTFTLSSNPDNMYLKVTADGNGNFVGYFILTCDEAYGREINNPWATGKVSTNSVMNGDFCKANILYNYWRDYRLSKAGTMNGSAETFLSTQWLLQQKNVKRYYDTPPEPLYGLSGDYIARINEWTRDLETGYVDMNLTYQEIT
jgi:hypothetical protein